MQSGKWIRYKSGESKWKEVSLVEYGRVEVECAYTRVYHSALPLLALLSPSARSLMDFLCAVMQDGNLVFSNRPMRYSFIKHMERAGVGITDGSVVRCFMELTDGGLLLKVKRGVYRVNPEYFMKNKGENREQLIRVCYENDKKE